MASSSTAITVSHGTWAGCLGLQARRRNFMSTQVFTPLLCASRNTLFIKGGSLWRRGPSLSSKASSGKLAVFASSEFADMAANKFRDDLIVELEREKETADVKGKIADICAKILRGYAESFNGTISSQPFENMKKALQEEGLPTSLPLRAAIWWARAHLTRDWQQWTSANR